MTTIDLNLHPFQQAVYDTKAPNAVIEAARRGGKSRVALRKLQKVIQEKMPEHVSEHVTPPFHAWIVAPNFPQSTQVWTELLTFIPREWMMGEPSIEHKTIRLNGALGGRAWGLIEVKSAHEANSLQTAGLDFLWVTEAQEISNEAFNRMVPMLHSPDRKLNAIWEGIPSLYRDHWFWRMCDAAMSGQRGYEYFHWTCYQNPMLSAYQLEDIESDKALMTDAAWRRMYLAERSESAGFFKNIDAAVSGDMLATPLPGARYVAGLDLGRKHDATVLWILDANQRKGVYHQRWDAGEDWSQQREGVIYACQQFDVNRLFVDATGMGGDMFYQALSEAGLPVEEYIFTEPTRMDLLNKFAVSMERYTAFFPAVTELMREMRAYQFIKRGNGKPRPDHPEGEHDDEIMAFGMGLLLCEDLVPESPRQPGRGRMSYLIHGNGDGPIGVGHRMQIQARRDRMQARWERSGITL